MGGCWNNNNLMWGAGAFKLHKRFCEGREDVDDGERTSQTITARTDGKD